MKNKSNQGISKKHVVIIAEAGVNHNGNLKMACEMIKVAATAGADMIKFQTFKAENLVTRTAVKAGYQQKTTSEDQSQFDMLKKLEFSIKDHNVLIKFCREHEVGFISSAFDLESIEFLSGLGQKIFKIPSCEITNLPYLRKIGALKREVIMSTGMSDLGEIEDALNVLQEAGTPWEKITVLHCNTEYPTPMNDVNLRAMQIIGVAFPGVRIGYSDHTTGIEVPIAAVALGANVIEKHFTLDRQMEGPDHKASLEQHELRGMIKAIRNIERAMGDGIKRPSQSEVKNKIIIRKSIVAAKDIKMGEIFTPNNIAVKRPGTGISPMLWDEILERKSLKDYKKDEIIDWRDTVYCE